MPALTHDEVRERLPDYVTSAALGNVPQLLDPDVAAHLTTCSECRAAYAELLKLTTLAFNGQIPIPSDVPAPDLRFLERSAEQLSAEHRTVSLPDARDADDAGSTRLLAAVNKPLPAPEPAPWLLDAIGRLNIRFSEGLLETLRQPAFAGASRGRLLYRYIQEPGSLPNLDLTIEVSTQEQDPARACIRVQVEVPSRDPLDQSGSKVLLAAGEHRWEGETDESGCVDFYDVPLDALPRLRVEILPPREEG